MGCTLRPKDVYVRHGESALPCLQVPQSPQPDRDLKVVLKSRIVRFIKLHVADLVCAVKRN